MMTTLDKLTSLDSYMAGRKHVQPGLIAYRQRRTVALGEHMRVQFEDEMTVRYQALEVLRIERNFAHGNDGDAVRHELDAYAHLLPDGNSWRATLLIECPDAARRQRELPALDRAARHLYIDVGTLPRAYARANEDIGDIDERPSAVHFLRFPLSPALRQALLAGAPALLGCAHPQHALCVPIPAYTLDSLRNDLMQAPLSTSTKVSLRKAAQVPA